MFALYYDAKQKRVRAVNGSGRSPQALTLAKVREMGITSSYIPATNVNSATVPGAAAAWVDIHEHFGGGTLTLSQLLEVGTDSLPLSSKFALA